MSTKIIKMNRGDSLSFNVRIPDKNDSSKTQALAPNDILYFALLYPHQKFEDAVMLRACLYGDDAIDQTTGEITIALTPNDTRCLEPGVYYYTVKLQRGGTLASLSGCDEPDEVRTIINRTKFIINE